MSLITTGLRDVIPDALMDLPQWVLWQYEERDGERTKVPYQAVPDQKGQHQRAKSNDPSTWSDFIDAHVIASEMPDRFGVGFMLRGSPIVGTDFDGVIKDGKPEPFVLAVLALLGNPYCEVTPSGNGLRAFVECPALPAGKRRFTRSKPEKYGCEIYSGSEGGRFLTVTGNRFSGEGVPKLADISLPYVLITQILNGKFKDLWLGKIDGYPSQSEADAALAAMLVPLFNRDPEKIEDAFCVSRLGQREKWVKREDYRKRTIEHALALPPLDSGVRLDGAAPGRNGTAANSANGAEPKREQKIEPDYHFTELGNAKRLVAKFGDNIRYNFEAKKWFEWTGKIWSQDRKGSMKRRMEAVIQDILRDAAASQDLKERNTLIKWALMSEAESTAKNSIGWAQSKVPILTNEFDTNIYLLNVNNGTLDLRTREFFPHRREDLNTKISPVDYDPTAKCPRWEQFLREVVDAGTIPFLQRAIGYSLTGSTVEQCLFLLHGLGKNGKSVFLATLQYILGDYAMQTDWQSFTVSKKGGVEIRNDIARLHAARLVVAIESEQNARLAESLLKALTGDLDKITARFLYQESFEFKPTLKLWLATNHKPRIVGADEAIWRRIRLIPFNITIAADKRDKHLIDKLRAEAPGILNWSLEGLRLYQQDGLQESEAVLSATAQYRQHSDVLQHFLDARGTLGKEAEVRSSDLYAAYKAWVDAAGEFKMNERDFGTAMEERGFKRAHRSARKDKPGGVYWFGIRLNQEAQSNPSVILSGSQKSEEELLPF